MQLKAEASAHETRITGAANAEADAARMNVYADFDARILLALAARDLAGNLPQIGTVNLAPDTLSAALSRIAAPSIDPSQTAVQSSSDH